MADNRQVINDPIHGNIQLHPLCMKIIDTPQFQRLRFIKQLGGAYFVYPGAAHNRFEHSIGVCHLAGRLVRALRKQKSKALENVEITPEDELCVEVAALCHDLGHGPFSHVFDTQIIPKLRTDERREWKHEQGSVDMIDHMIEENTELKDKFIEANIFEDLQFIRELIVGPRDASSNEWPYKGRPKEKGFLYEIVSNKRNGIDVDKWDYFARDCYMLGIGKNFNHNRCIDFSRVIDVDGEKQICFRNKEAANLYDMFHTRNLLHQRAYKHKTTNIIEIMIAEALVSANDFITFPGKDSKACTMSEAIDDMKAYSLLNDDVIHRILRSTDPRLYQSKQLLERVLKRNFYRLVGEKRFSHGEFKDENEVKEDMKKIEETNITEDDFSKIVIDIVNFDYGMEDKNPIDFVRFFTKDNPDKAEQRHKEDVSLLLPKEFAEQLVRVYSRDLDSNFVAKFETWVKNTRKGTKKQKNIRVKRGWKQGLFEHHYYRILLQTRWN
ncbi:deoxynucleoside triphosphate triphosphohydrolase SAMHD1-like [Mercenaria mercenaria]|uniref:deoxynucleoside triphosphate triphosphohydrolase SAMHD1-like n=1 Tax=Mercenaria mercenaria TaxID=6596 RepID=UPI00234F03F6|nr:deoxynucleoside triphosphate triphosphohydrolase SAMHD1-like [Mercenaria mercenaria]XP_053387579.1 deoxynucleoside triphosphate triphosphohydrolase SAMHD1-like [Mercenaria mercenaria]